MTNQETTDPPGAEAPAQPESEVVEIDDPSEASSLVNSQQANMSTSSQMLSTPLGHSNQIVDYLHDVDDLIPEEHLTGYWGNFDDFDYEFNQWYTHRQDMSDTIQYTRDEQEHATRIIILRFQLGVTKYFQARMDTPYSGILYESTLAMIRHQEDDKDSRTRLYIPWVRGPDYFNDDLATKYKTAWFYQANSGVSNPELFLDFCYYDAV